MPRVSEIRLEGRVVEILKPGSLFRVKLSNGHRLLGYIERRQRVAASLVDLGAKIILRISPFDFSNGLIDLEKNK